MRPNRSRPSGSRSSNSTVTSVPARRRTLELREIVHRAVNVVSLPPSSQVHSTVTGMPFGSGSAG